MDLISRQAAIYAVDEMSYAFNVKTNAHMAFIKALAELPSAERRGRWELNIDDKGWSWDIPYVCDQCGKWNGIETPYCPHCGAKMDGEEK